MKGRYVERRWGWDCHGLPVEFEVENELGLQGKQDIEKMGVQNFNEACRGIVLRYTKEWEQVVNRTGRWADFKNSYRTMDPNFMESVWWVFRQLWDKGLIFEGYRVMPYSWRISTPLSNFEAGLNYKEVQDPALTVRFKSSTKNRSLLAWTTTPWTLPSNLALSVHPELDYVEVIELKTQEHLVLGKARLAAYFKSESEYQLLSEFKGTALEGETYEPVFGHFADRKAKGAFRVLLGDHVTATDGTGIVHTAPAFGEEDFDVCKKNGIELVDPTDASGVFTSLLPEYQGQHIKDAEKNIIKDLKTKGVLYRHDTVMHNVAFCWRSDTPLMNKPIATWFVKIDPIKEDFIKNNLKTHWVPENLRDGRFGNWLANARDWNISRNRYWGTPLPIWRCTPECKERVCIGSVKELEEKTGKKVTDLHKHFVDELHVACPKCKKPMNRIPEVLDCWFESGSMPYGQAHYPFENKEKFDKSFPADFIAEGLDQTRGWFYTLSVLSTALFNRPPFKNVIVNGLVLAEDGKKMSKRLKNYPDPTVILDTYGADALRAYLMNSPASHAEELRFSENGVKEIIRSVLLPFWNSYSFFVTYAKADGWEPKSFDPKSLSSLDNDLDKWVVSRLQTLIKSVDDHMAVYHLADVVPAVITFIDELTNWYIRLNRRRFWSDEKSKDKANAYDTLYFVLTEFCKVLAPILPFMTEEIYLNLASEREKKESVHLSTFPVLKKEWMHTDLESQFALVEQVIVMGRNLRNTHKLKVRQPLAEFLVITPDESDRKAIERYQGLIQQELNLKKVSFTSDESKWVSLSAKPNSKALGPRMGGKMKAVAQKIKELTPKEVASLEEKGFLEIEGEKVFPADIQIERQPKQEGVIQNVGKVTVWLDTKLNDGLISEGRARELVNRIQKIRKDSDFQVTDRIKVKYGAPAELSKTIQEFKDYICSETLAIELHPAEGGPWTTEEDIDGILVGLRVDKT